MFYDDNVHVINKHCHVINTIVNITVTALFMTIIVGNIIVIVIVLAVAVIVITNVVINILKETLSLFRWRQRVFYIQSSCYDIDPFLRQSLTPTSVLSVVSTNYHGLTLAPPFCLSLT